MPAGRKRKTYAHKAKADQHIPSTNAWDWVVGGADVEDYDPNQANNEVSHHYWGQPLWALSFSSRNLRFDLSSNLSLLADLIAQF